MPGIFALPAIMPVKAIFYILGLSAIITSGCITLKDVNIFAHAEK